MNNRITADEARKIGLEGLEDLMAFIYGQIRREAKKTTRASIKTPAGTSTVLKWAAAKQLKEDGFSASICSDQRDGEYIQVDWTAPVDGKTYRAPTIDEDADFMKG